MTFEDAMVGATVKFKDNDGNDRHGIITSVFLDKGGGFVISLPDNRKIWLYKEHTNGIPIMDIQVVEYKGFCVGDRVKSVNYNLYGEIIGIITGFIGDSHPSYWVGLKIDGYELPLYVTVDSLTKRLDKISVDSIKDSKFRSYAADVIKEALNRAEVPWRIFSWELTTDGELTIAARFDDKVRVGVAKCHPDDRFDVCIGAQVAIQRIKEQFISEKWKPKDGDEYWYVGSDNEVYFKYHCGNTHDEMATLLKNYFKTRDDALANVENVRKRYKAVEEFLKGYDNE